MNKLQEEFFEALQGIQELAVVNTLCDNKKRVSDMEKTEDLLYYATYEAIYGVLELVDGYTRNSLQLDLIERTSKESLRTGIELHDTCPGYLRYEK